LNHYKTTFCFKIAERNFEAEMELLRLERPQTSANDRRCASHWRFQRAGGAEI
jgi:hypothetical protein